MVGRKRGGKRFLPQNGSRSSMRGLFVEETGDVAVKKKQCFKGIRNVEKKKAQR